MHPGRVALASGARVIGCCGSLGFTAVPQVRGRFSVHRVSADEAKFKLCRVKEVAKGIKGVPYMVTHDGRTIRYPDPQLGFMDTIKLDLETGKVTHCHRT